MSYCLWVIVAVRLIVPFSIESVWSIIPFAAQPITSSASPGFVPASITHGEAMDSALLYGEGSLPSWYEIAAHIWLLGVAVMFLHGIVSYYIIAISIENGEVERKPRLRRRCFCAMTEPILDGIVYIKRKMRGAVRSPDGPNIYESGNIKSPFVLGFFSPKIYLPLGLTAQEREYVVLHEKIHIRRRDHIIKFAAYLILCVHWFNPLVWLAFRLTGADMEMACDERVLREMGIEATKANYSMSLITLAAEARFITVSPLAFGEGNIKGRVKNVLNFKKRSRAMTMAAIVLAIILSAGLMLNQADAAQPEDSIPVVEIPPIPEPQAGFDASIPFDFENGRIPPPDLVPPPDIMPPRLDALDIRLPRLDVPSHPVTTVQEFLEAREMLLVLGDEMNDLSLEMTALGIEMSILGARMSFDEMAALGQEMEYLGAQMEALGDEMTAWAGGKAAFADSHPVSAQEARAIALDFAGLNRPRISWMQSAEIVDGRLVWAFTFWDGVHWNSRHEIIVDAITGAVTASLDFTLFN